MSSAPEPNPYQSPKTASSQAEAVREAGSTSAVGLWGTLVGGSLLAAGLFWMSPGYGVIAALILVPAQLRAIVRYFKEAHQTGQWPSPNGQVLLFLSSILISVPVVIAAAIAFFAVCFTGAWLASSLLPRLPDDPYGITLALWGGVPVGALVGLIVFGVAWRWSCGKRILWERRIAASEADQEIPS